MQTKTINVYSFSELSEDAKQKAINDFNENDYFDFSEVNETVKTFKELFNLSENHYSNSVFSYSQNLDESIENLKGLRLRTYILNNFQLWKGKIYWLTSKIELNGSFPMRKRYSRILKDNCCILTGVCYDEDILKPIYDFIKNPDNSNVYDLLDNCFESIEKSVQSEQDYRYTEDYLNELSNANDYTFTEYGKMENI